MQLWFSRHIIMIFALVLVTSSFLVVGCTQASDTNADTGNLETNLPVKANLSEDMNLPQLEGMATVEMVINGSPVILEINGDDAPLTAGNFVDLVDQGFYNGKLFHRVIKEPEPFVVQGGDPKGDGTGGYIDPETSQERTIPLEIKLKNEQKPTYGKALGRQGSNFASSVLLNHKRGAIAMARSQSPNSASSQFYFALADLAFLDGDYAVFGYVTQGMETVDAIQQGDRITTAKVTSGLEQLKK